MLAYNPSLNVPGGFAASSTMFMFMFGYFWYKFGINNWNELVFNLIGKSEASTFKELAI